MSKPNKKKKIVPVPIGGAPPPYDSVEALCEDMAKWFYDNRPVMAKHFGRDESDERSCSE
jgi:hypothetical protein